jgi:hypothetical protein
VLHLLANRRDDRVGMRTQTINRLHRVLTDLVPAAPAATHRQERQCAAQPDRRDRHGGCHPPTIGRQPRHRRPRPDRRINTIEERIKAAVAQSKTTLGSVAGHPAWSSPPRCSAISSSAASAAVVPRAAVATAHCALTVDRCWRDLLPAGGSRVLPRACSPRHHGLRVDLVGSRRIQTGPVGSSG